MSLRELRERIDLISSKFVDAQIEKEKADPLMYEPDLEGLAAFRLLTHAELETFLEERARSGLTDLKAHLLNAKPSSRLAQLLAIGAHLGKPLDLSKINSSSVFRAQRDKIINAASEKISENNGIKRDSFLFLNLFAGQTDNSIEPDLLAELDSFGGSRGDVAHKPVHRVKTVLAPSDEKEAVYRLLSRLEAYIGHTPRSARRRRLHYVRRMIW